MCVKSYFISSCLMSSVCLRRCAPNFFFPPPEKTSPCPRRRDNRLRLPSSSSSSASLSGLWSVCQFNHRSPPPPQWNKEPLVCHVSRPSHTTRVSCQHSVIAQGIGNRGVSAVGDIPPVSACRVIERNLITSPQPPPPPASV